MLAGDIFGPETNFRIGPRASMRNFTCMPPTSMTRMWRAAALPGILLLARIGLDSPRNRCLSPPAPRRASAAGSPERPQQQQIVCGPTVKQPLNYIAEEVC